MTTEREALDQIAGYLNWTEDEFHLEVPAVRRHIRTILAAVRPVAGVTLPPEDRALIVDVLRDIPDMDLRMAAIRPSRQQEIVERRALAARLEAAS